MKIPIVNNLQDQSLRIITLHQGAFRELEELILMRELSSFEQGKVDTPHFRNTHPVV